MSIESLPLENVFHNSFVYARLALWSSVNAAMPSFSFHVNVFYCTPFVIFRHETMTAKKLVQGCYAVAWMEVESATFELLGTTLSTEPLRPVRGARKEEQLDSSFNI